MLERQSVRKKKIKKKNKKKRERKKSVRTIGVEDSHTQAIFWAGNVQMF